MNKLFAPLNEQIEVVRIKNTPIDQKLYESMSNDIIFNNDLNDIIEHKLEEEFLNQYCDYLLFEEFKQFLNEDPLILDEETLNEGKILNNIRWKLALFSLRFLSNTSIDAFFIAYYADKSTGKPTDKGKEFCRKSRKEKLAKMRELANGMKEEDKQKVINSQAAKQCEKSGILSLGIGALSFGAAYTSKIYGDRARYVEKDAKNTEIQTGIDNGDEWVGVSGADAENIKSHNYTSYATTGTIGGGNPDYFKTGDISSWVVSDKPTGIMMGNEYVTTRKDAGVLVHDPDSGLTHAHYNGYKIGGYITNTLAAFSSLLFGIMWGSIILASVATAKGVLQLHKANTIRRDEIMDELKSKMDPKIARNLAKQYKQERKQEKKNNR